MDFINKCLCSLVNGGTNWCLGTAFRFYNMFVKGARDMLATHPDAWMGGGGWEVAETANGIFVGIGSSLVAVFFLISFFAESVEPKNDMRMENVLRMLFKLCIAEWFVSNSMDLAVGLFGLVDAFSGGVGSLEITYESLLETVNSIDNAGTGAVLCGCSFIFMIGLIASGVMIFYAAFIRFFKVLCLVPYGAIANATLVGGWEVRKTAASYWRYVCSVVLEAATMLLALKLCAVLCSGQSSIELFSSLTGDGMSGAEYVFGYMLQSLFLALACVGSVRGASSLTQRALGL